MPVFISHRTQDDDKAKAIAYRLGQHNIPCYLDDFDPRLRSSRQITSLLIDAIHKCTHLMALVTNDTRESWWVPFEIGVARESPRRITTYDNSTMTLPEYLTEWPVLTKPEHLDQFAAVYHKDKTAKPIREKYAMAYRNLVTPDDFHRELKASLGQR
jgi:hypothetical protein